MVQAMARPFAGLRFKKPKWPKLPKNWTDYLAMMLYAAIMVFEIQAGRWFWVGFFALGIAHRVWRIARSDNRRDRRDDDDDDLDAT